MRRKDKQITDRKLLEEIMEQNTVCRVGLVDGDKPYVIPMNYGYKMNTLYLHSALEGHKIDIIEKNNNVCIEISDSIEAVTSDIACGHGTKYRSVICFGTIHPVIGSERKTEGLRVILNQQTGDANRNIHASEADKVAVFKVAIETITGKVSGLQA